MKVGFSRSFGNIAVNATPDADSLEQFVDEVGDENQPVVGFISNAHPEGPQMGLRAIEALVNLSTNEDSFCRALEYLLGRAFAEGEKSARAETASVFKTMLDDAVARIAQGPSKPAE